MNQAERLAEVTAERDRYRDEANRLRTVCHHLLEANRHQNTAAVCHGQAEAQLREAVTVLIGWDPDRVA